MKWNYNVTKDQWDNYSLDEQYAILTTYYKLGDVFMYVSNNIKSIVSSYMLMNHVKPYFWTLRIQPIDEPHIAYDTLVWLLKQPLRDVNLEKLGI